MPGPVLRRATLLSCLLLCVAVESPPPARAAGGAPPKTMQGFLRVEIRGLTAVSGGFLAGMLAGQGMYVATAHRMLPGFFKIPQWDGQANVGQGHAPAFQRVRARSDSVLRYYRRAMPEKGWQLTAEREGTGGVLLLYQKAGRAARVEVVGSDTGMSEIWLRSRVPEKPKTEKK